MTTLPKFSVAHIYNPDNQTKEQLIDSFVVRLPAFQRIYQEIKVEKERFPVQHYVIEGKRGMGKTSFLLRLAYEIENDPGWNTWLLPLVFNEEEYRIRKLYKLWERIAELLEDKDETFTGLFHEMDEMYERYQSDEDYEYDIFQLLTKRLRENDKKIILFIDNFGDIFSRFSRQEIQRMRTVLQTSPDLQIIAASSVVLEAFFEYEHPFYEFFKIIRLRGLNQQETEELFLKLGETYKQEQIRDIIDNQKGRVEALRRLTGGVIRTLVLLFEIFIDRQQGNAFNDLEAILDRVSPLYKHRMDDLPAQQQEIVNAIALAWDAVTAGEIAKQTRLSSKVVSAQLSSLVKNEIVSRILTTTKNHLYQVNERFFNIWYLMRHGNRGDKRKVRWLVRFLEEWCDDREIVRRTHQHVQALKKGGYDERGAYYMAEALAQTRHLPGDAQHELLSVTRDFLKKQGSEFERYLSESDKELHEKAVVFYEKREWEKALPILLKMKELDEFRIGVCYYFIKEIKKAENFYLKAVEKEHADAMFNLALLYKTEFKDLKKAEKYYLQAVDKGHASAMHNLAHLYSTEFKDFKKAEKFYIQAIEKGEVRAILKLAHLYETEFKKFEEAEKLYLQAVEKGQAKAMHDLAHFYENKFEDYEKAEKYFLMAVENGDTNASGCLANLYFTKLGDSEKAEKFYLQAIEKGDDRALPGLALLYHIGFKDFKKAERFYLQAVEKGNTGAMLTLAALYDFEFEDFKKAEKFYLQAVENGIFYNEAIIEQSKNFLEYTAIPLLARQHYQLLHDTFTSPQAETLHLKDRLKPIWYALMYYLQDQYPNEYLRMGDELKETVEEIIAEVEKLREEMGE